MPPARTLTRLYALLLRLAPLGYQQEYGEELLQVVDLAVQEARRKGLLPLFAFTLRELAGFLRLLLRLYLTEWRSGMSADPVTRMGKLLAIVAYSVPFLFILTFYLPAPTTPTAQVFRWGLFALGIIALLAVLFAGFRQGLPRWALPFFGLLLWIPSFYVLTVAAMFVFYAPLLLPIFRSLRPAYLPFWPRLVSGGFQTALGWAIYLLAGYFAIRALAFRAHFKPLLARARKDWTQLSFLLYGGLYFVLWLNFDEYKGDEPYMLASIVGLLLGAWLYLILSYRGGPTWLRILPLLVGLAFAVWIQAYGKWVLVPQQEWSEWFADHPIGIERWYESLSTLSHWVFGSLALLAAAFLRFPEKGAEAAAVLPDPLPASPVRR